MKCQNEVSYVTTNLLPAPSLHVWMPFLEDLFEGEGMGFNEGAAGWNVRTTAMQKLRLYLKLYQWTYDKPCFQVCQEFLYVRQLCMFQVLKSFLSQAAWTLSRFYFFLTFSSFPLKPPPTENQSLETRRYPDRVVKWVMSSFQRSPVARPLVSLPISMHLLQHLYSQISSCALISWHVVFSGFVLTQGSLQMLFSLQSVCLHTY